jgi:hypothetical protein
VRACAALLRPVLWASRALPANAMGWPGGYELPTAHPVESRHARTPLVASR